MELQGSTLCKKKTKKKSLHLVRLCKKATAWEQVSHNDVVLTDVGQLFISLPKSVPTGAQADTPLACFALWADCTYWPGFGGYR